MKKTGENQKPFFDIIGTGSGESNLSPAYQLLIKNADILAGGNHLLEMVSHLNQRATWVCMGGDIHDFCQQLFDCWQQEKRIALVVSGDPLFFSLGNIFLRYFKRKNFYLRFWPNISCLQGAAAVLKIPWTGIKTVSFHGRRDWHGLWNALMEVGLSCSHVCLLTDGENTPAVIAGEIVERGFQKGIGVTIERYGCPEQKVTYWKLSHLAAERSVFPSLTMLLVTTPSPSHPFVGADSASYLSDGDLITKQAIRSIVLGKLHIHPQDTIWDVGAGSGSVGIEASCLARQGQVYAIEKKKNRIKNILANRSVHGAWVLEVIEGDIMDVGGTLPAPDAIFVGGGLGKERGETILHLTGARLRPGGRMVIVCVLLGTLEKTRKFLKENFWTFDIEQAQMALATPLGQDMRFQTSSTVWIISARKPDAGGPSF